MRSRTGCATCRAKRVKCDELKPACKTCIARGLECGGYGRKLRWSAKHERYNPIATAIGRSRSGARRTSEDSMGPQHDDQADMVLAMPPSISPTATEPTDGKSCQQHIFDTSPSNQLGSNEHGVARNLEFGDINQAVAQSGLALPSAGSQRDWLTVSSDDADDALWGDRANFCVAPILPQFQGTALSPAVADTPSFLVTYWFQEVCSVWSAYDSNMNLNRTIAATLWPDSEVVSTCLRSMSAAFLAAKIPYMKQTSLAMMKSATTAIRLELATIKHQTKFDTLPMSVLFGLFCLGTTICWLDASQLGVPYLREAKALLSRVNQQRGNLCEGDRYLLKFFDKSWVYCDMLLAVVTYRGTRDVAGVADEVEEYYADRSAVFGPEPADSNEMPHPWTGVSTTALQLFTQAMNLCRCFRRNTSRRSSVIAHDLKSALKLIEEAKGVEERLWQLDFEYADKLSETGDENTPRQHLVQAGDAYRLSALLHLYQTFPDLIALRVPADTSDLESGAVPQNSWIISLSLRLVNILEQLPAQSGSKMVQPLLCITAATGLRLDTPNFSITKSLNGADYISVTDNAGLGEDCDMSEYINRLTHAGVADNTTHLSLTGLEVGNARHFVLKRLNILETLLPPKPIIMAKDLVHAIWQAYDGEGPGKNSVHWLDVMEKQGLRSFFG